MQSHGNPLLHMPVTALRIASTENFNNPPPIPGHLSLKNFGPWLVSLLGFEG
jgi:hypothetical protein